MQKPEMNSDEFGTLIIDGARRARAFFRLQASLTALCWIALIAAISIKFIGGYSKLVIPLAILGTVLGFGSWIVGRMAAPIYSRAEEVRKVLERFNTAVVQKGENIRPQKIPLTIGFINLSGDDLNTIASEDASALSPLFARTRVAADHQIPPAEILFVYAHLNEDGTIKGPTPSNIRQVVQLANAAVVVVASPNSPRSIQNAAVLPGPKTANIVFTLDRNGSGLGRFFGELFMKMRDGKDMLSAWVELAPQSPNANTSYAPQTILLAEGGKIAFLRG